jgi:hypothetical protein
MQTNNYHKMSQYQQQAHNDYCKQLAIELDKQMYFFPEEWDDVNPNGYTVKMLTPYIEQTFDNDVHDIVGYVISDIKYFMEELDINHNSPDTIAHQRRVWNNDKRWATLTA